MQWGDAPPAWDYDGTGQMTMGTINPKEMREMIHRQIARFCGHSGPFIVPECITNAMLDLYRGIYKPTKSWLERTMFGSTNHHLAPTNDIMNTPHGLPPCIQSVTDILLTCIQGTFVSSGNCVQAIDFANLCPLAGGEHLAGTSSDTTRFPIHRKAMTISDWTLYFCNLPRERIIHLASFLNIDPSNTQDMEFGILDFPEFARHLLQDCPSNMSEADFVAIYKSIGGSTQGGARLYQVLLAAAYHEFSSDTDSIPRMNTIDCNELGPGTGSMEAIHQVFKLVARQLQAEHRLESLVNSELNLRDPEVVG